MKCNHLAIEITRKCNRNCEHCMRGDSQNISISHQIIDKLFEEVDDCEYISLMGGEPFLEIETIQYLVEKIINSNWSTNNISVTTNGTIRDIAIIDIFNRFCESRDNRKVFITVSGDEFHDTEESGKTYDYYCEHITNDNILLLYKENINFLKYVGRGVDWVNNNPYKYKNKVIRGLAEKHRIKVADNKVFCSLYITCNGDVSFDEEFSFSELDDISMGNILKDSLEDIIFQNNKNCLMTCCDYENFSMLSWLLKDSNQITNENVEYMIAKILFDGIYKKRQVARSMFPLLSTQDIIVGLMLPKDYLFDIQDEVNKIYNCFRKYKNANLFIFGYNDVVSAYMKNTKGLNVIEIEKARKNYTVLAILKYANQLPENVLQDINNNSYYFRMATCTNPTQTNEFINLKKKNDYYLEKGIVADNSMVLPCNIGDSLTGEMNIYKKVQDYLTEQYNKGMIKLDE